MTKKLIKRYRGVAALILAVFVLAACSSDGGDGGAGGDGGPSDPSEVNFGAAQQVLSNAQTNLQELDFPISVETDVLSFAQTVDAWDGQDGTYSEGPFTYTVSSGGGVWTWSIVYDDGEVSYTASYTIEQTTAGWSFSYTLDGVVVFSGTLSNDGLTGSFAFFFSGDQLYELSWSPASAPYYLTFVYTVFIEGEPGTVYNASISQDGNQGEWSIDSDGDGTPETTGTWPE